MIARGLLLLCLGLGICAKAQYTYFNSISGSPGDMIPEGVLNIEVQGDELVIMGNSSASGQPFQFLRRYDANGMQLDQSNYSFGSDFIYVGRTNSFLKIPGSSDFLFSQGIYSSEIQGYVVKYDSDLDTIWTKRYNQYSPETYFYTHVFTGDGFLLAGENGGSGERGIFVMKIDLDGNVIWHNEVHDPADGVIYRNRYISQYGDLIILTGASGLGTDTQSSVEILDSNGNSLKRLEALGGIVNGVMHQVQSEDEDLLFTVQMAVAPHPGSPPEVSYTNLFLYTIDFSDTSLVQVAQYFEGEDWLQGFPTKMIKVSDGYVLAGMFFNDNPQQNRHGWIMKIDTNYIQEWYTVLNYDDLVTSEHWLYDMEKTIDGGYVCVGTYNTDFDPFDRTWLVKVDACGDLEWMGCEPVSLGEYELEDMKLEVYPNPAQDVINIEVDVDFNPKNVQLTNMLGVIILEKEYEKVIDLSKLESGLYVLQITNQEGQRLTKKLIVE